MNLAPLRRGFFCPLPGQEPRGREAREANRDAQKEKGPHEAGPFRSLYPGYPRVLSAAERPISLLTTFDNALSPCLGQTAVTANSCLPTGRFLTV